MMRHFCPINQRTRSWHLSLSPDAALCLTPVTMSHASHRDIGANAPDERDLASGRRGWVLDARNKEYWDEDPPRTEL